MFIWKSLLLIEDILCTHGDICRCYWTGDIRRCRRDGCVMCIVSSWGCQLVVGYNFVSVLLISVDYHDGWCLMAPLSSLFSLSITPQNIPTEMEKKTIWNRAAAIYTHKRYNVFRNFISINMLFVNLKLLSTV